MPVPLGGGPKPLWAIIGEAAPTGWGLVVPPSPPDSGLMLMQYAQEGAQGADTKGAAPAPALVPMDLPGVGRTYFDSEVAQRVKDFVDRNRAAGIDVQINSGFRTTAGQEKLQEDPNGTTPAKPGNSLHEAGRAFDILLNDDAKAHLDQIVENAKRAGFSWGGDFHSPDPGHFFIEVPEGVGNRAPRIQRAQDEYRQEFEK